MASLGTSSTSSGHILEKILAEKPISSKAGSGVQPRSTIRRWLVSAARSLHEKPFLFPITVKAFRGLQHLGINVTPNHFYWPVPDISDLEKREWCEYVLPGHEFSIDKHARFARKLASAFARECNFSTQPCDGAYHYNNGYFEAVDAEIAYSMVRWIKPSHIIEIGTGYSTRVLATALERNSAWNGVEGQLVSIDPTAERLSNAHWRDRVTQIPCAVQDLEIGFFDLLHGGDILFIDSSHVVATGSDVTREFLQILPRLRSGVLVHLHDIFLPSDYPRDAVLKNLWFWSEQYLLQAFLSFNEQFEVLWGSSAMQSYCPSVLEECFPSWRHSYRDMPESKRRFVPTSDGDRVWPSSFWMRRV